MHTYNKLDFGFVILSPEHEIGNLQCTVRSIKNNYDGIPYLCVTAHNIDAEDLREMNTICPTIKGKNTITSLINMGIKKGCKEWNLIVMEGTPIRRKIDQKYSLFIEDEKDVLFPIIIEHDRQGNISQIRNSFEDATLNGMFIHYKTFKTVGDFVDAPIPTSKFMWALGAHDIGCRFKGILGAKLV